MKKKHELLKYAYDNYPKGTKYTNLGSGEVSTSSGVFHIDSDGVRDSETWSFVLGTEDKWAVIVESRKFIMRSEDGVDLYAKDSVVTVRREHALENNWKNPLQKVMASEVCNALLNDRYNLKAFSTHEAAQQWIEEQNKPKEEVVHLGGRDLDRVVVSKGTLKIRHLNGGIYLISAYELEAIYKAYQSLQN